MNKPTKPKKQPQSIWLMLGSAVLLSLGGWVAIINQTGDPREAHIPVPTVIELPPVQSSAPRSHNTAAPQANAPANNETAAQSSSSRLRQVRPMMRSRSSN
jgi:hypothetical protein